MRSTECAMVSIMSSLNSGIVLKALGIAEHQGQLPHDILQIMRDKGEAAAEELKLAAFRQCVGGLFFSNIARGLLSDCHQELIILPIEWPIGAWLAQGR